MLEGRDVDLTLAEEKRQLQHLNVGLAEKVAVMREAEANVVAKMHDFRYLLNFAILSLWRALTEQRELILHTLRSSKVV